MKKRMYLFIALFAGAHGLYAQDCAKGYCPSTIVVHHKAGDLSPIGADITYNVKSWNPLLDSTEFGCLSRPHRV